MGFPKGLKQSGFISWCDGRKDSQKTSFLLFLTQRLFLKSHLQIRFQELSFGKCPWWLFVCYSYPHETSDIWSLFWLALVLHCNLRFHRMRRNVRQLWAFGLPIYIFMLRFCNLRIHQMSMYVSLYHNVQFCDTIWYSYHLTFFFTILSFCIILKFATCS